MNCPNTTKSHILDYAEVVGFDRDIAERYIDNTVFSYPYEVGIEGWNLIYPMTGCQEIVESWDQSADLTEYEVNCMYWDLFDNMTPHYILGYDNKYIGSMIIAKYMSWLRIFELNIIETIQ